ncbi:hypothetical protein AcW1_006146 [Taiwanofungus camphoratus]|nr:hypothetical protein AcW1_006146 [Antrodia cinnamomea]
MGRSIPEITQIGPRLVLGPNLVGSQCKLAVMSYLHPLRRPPRLNISYSLRRWYASTNKQVDTSTQKTEVLKSENEGAIESEHILFHASTSRLTFRHKSLPSLHARKTLF